jgi:hypothetical protein
VSEAFCGCVWHVDTAASIADPVGRYAPGLCAQAEMRLSQLPTTLRRLLPFVNLCDSITVFKCYDQTVYFSKQEHDIAGIFLKIST